MRPREPPRAERPGGRREAGACQERVRLGRAEAWPQARPRGLVLPPWVCFGGRQWRGAVQGPQPTGFLGRFFAVGYFINKNVRNLCCHSVPFPGGARPGLRELGGAVIVPFLLFSTRSLSFASLPHPGTQYFRLSDQEDCTKSLTALPH